MSDNHQRSASRRLLCWAARFAPARLSDWVEAMIAELDFIDNNSDAVRWSIGCLILIVREALANLLSTALRAPSDSLNSAKQKSPGMRNGRLAAASALLLTAAFLLTSGFRQAIGIAAVTLTGRPTSYSDIAPGELDEMRAAAEQHRDARMLAFAALHDMRNEIAHQSAERAVSIDLRFTWIYYDLAHRAESDNQRAADMARLQQWDPQNGLLYLAEAGPLGQQAWSVPKGSSFSPDEAWVQMAARGFDAPQYNSYQRERFEIERDVARELRDVNPLRLANSVTGGRLPSMILIRRYADYVLDSANSPDDLARQARRVAAQGERMMACPSETENWAGQQLALDGYRKLESVSPAPEKDIIASRIAQLNPPQRPISPASSWSWTLTRALRPNAVTIQVSFVLIVMAILAMIAAAASLTIRPGKGSKTISGLFWVSAGTLLAASVASYVAYQPYATLLAEVMNPETSPDNSIRLVKVYYSYGYPASQFVDVYFWAGLTLLLLLVLAVVLARKLRRTMGRHSAPAVT